MSEMIMKSRVLTSFSRIHKSDNNVAKHTLECSIAAGFRHEIHLLLPDWDMTTDITILLARDARRVKTSLDPSVLDRNYITESGEI